MARVSHAGTVLLWEQADRSGLVGAHGADACPGWRAAPGCKRSDRQTGAGYAHAPTTAAHSETLLRGLYDFIATRARGR